MEYSIIKRLFFFQNARDVVALLLSRNASPNGVWSGHSPLSLAIASGNDLVCNHC